MTDKLIASIEAVSTHSHPKVAAKETAIKVNVQYSFNTQPPEGGCTSIFVAWCAKYQFQHTATRRWLHRVHSAPHHASPVSTHSHPKVAATLNLTADTSLQCFNTQPPEGGCHLYCPCLPLVRVSTHSHPKVAAYALKISFKFSMFQHTATRRWLRNGAQFDS